MAADEEPWSEEKLMGAARADELLFVTGQNWASSNIGYMLARRHIEDLVGQDFPSLITELLAKLLHLSSIELATTRD